MGNLTTPQTNDHRMSDFMKDVRQFGRDAAEGKDALPKLAIRVVKAAAEGVIAPYDPKVHGKDNPDDTRKVYEEYATSEGNKLIHEHTSGGLKAQVSKLRALTAMGHNPHCDAEQVVDRSLKLHREMRDNDLKVKGVYPALVDVARAQNNSETELTDDQIREAVAKGEGAEPTIEKKVDRARKLLDELITGEGKDGLSCQDDEIVKAEEMLREWIGQQEQKAQLAALMEQAAALGMKVEAPKPQVQVRWDEVEGRFAPTGFEMA